MLIAVMIVGCAVLVWGLVWGGMQAHSYYIKWKLEEAYKEMMEETPPKKHLFIVKK